MKKDPKKIAEEIVNLVSELAALAGAPAVPGSARGKKSTAAVEKDTSGATGGIRLLVEEGKLNSPMLLAEILECLRQEGRHYASQTVSMGLLGLVRKRVLTRVRDKGGKKWKYVVRR